MTWPWHTFSRPGASLWALLILGAAARLSAAVIGQVELKDSRVAQVRKHGDFSGVVVWLEPVSGPPAIEHPGRAKMIQQAKRFSPHVLVVPVGATVDFPNLDPIFHNAFSNFSGKVFDIGLYAPGSSRSVRFDRPGIVRIFCNIHSTMSAVIAVVDTPYFATTQTSGDFTIAGAPPGDYILHVFHERATPQTLDKLQQRIRIEGSSVNVGRISISESNYLPVQHKNKYGRDYPPNIEDGYQPARK
jgi:plastocyanin